MASKPRILYECRDIVEPSGGVRRLYRHVDILRTHGFHAYMLHHTPGYEPTWFDSRGVPKLYLTDGFKPRRDDFLVVPEGHADIITTVSHFPGIPIVIALSWSFIYRDLPAGTDWRDFGIADVIAGSAYIKEFIRSTMGLDSVVIPPGIDLQLFRPAPKSCHIAYMPRKNPAVFRMIAGGFASMQRGRGLPSFLPIDQVSHTEVAAKLGEAAIFLATGFPEGIARPPLEAMACGCIVVGFAGIGSREYMKHGVNCHLAEDYDVLAAADGLCRALTQFEKGDTSMQDAAQATANAYSLQREEASVLRYWRSTVQRFGYSL